LAKSLIELRTDLKSLKYQGPNGSNPPYVTKDINNPPSNSRTSLEVRSRVDDVVRVGKAMLPTNSRFIENQLKLNTLTTQTAVSGLRRFDAESIKKLVRNALEQGEKVGKVTLSTLAQTGVAGTGARIGLGFQATNSVAGLSGQVLPNEKSFKIEDKLKGSEKTGTKLSKEPNLGDSEYVSALGTITSTLPTTSAEGKKVENQSINSRPQFRSELKASKLEQQSTDSNLSKDSKLPQRLVLGVPGTSATLTLEPYIDAFSNTAFNSPTKSENGQIATQGSTPGYSLSAADDRLEPKKSAERNKVPDQSSQGVGNFDRQTGQQSSTVQLTYKTKQDSRYNKELRTKLGQQGLPKKPADYKETRNEGIDKVNAADIGEKVSDDLIKFYFKVITPELDQFLTFRAYLTDFSDSYQGSWSDTQYIGRADKMLNYTGFSRDVSLSFTIAASTRAEMKPLYRKIAYLASTTAPTYGGGDQNFMRGTLVELTVGDYIANTPGVLTSVNYKWQQNYPWEIVLKEDEDDVQQLPMVLDCSINFRPIHNFIPQTGLYPYITDTTSSRKFWETYVPKIIPEDIQTTSNIT